MNIARLLVLMLCGMPTLPLLAAETWYEVEVIVVAQRNPDAGSETWPAKSLPATPDAAQAIPVPGQPSISPDARLDVLPPENFRLQAEALRIAKDSNHELLLHTGWRQAGLTREQSIPLRIHAPSDDGSSINADPGREADTVLNAAPSTRLDGTLRLILARYLHLEADLNYFAAEEMPQGQGFFSLFASEQTEKPVYRLNETRRMRSRELHYLDHPMFGVIALITPYELPVAAAPAPKPAAAPAVPAAPATGATGSIRRN